MGLHPNRWMRHTAARQLRPRPVEKPGRDLRRRLLRTFAADAHRHRRLLIGIGISVAAVGLVLFLAQDKGTLQIRSALRADDPRFAGYLATQLNAPVTRGNRYTVLQNGD